MLPQVQTALTYMESVHLDRIDDRLQASREFYERLIPLAGAEEAVWAVENRTIALPGRDIGLRIYRPSGKAALPAVVFFHGGGFFKGSLDSHDRPLRQLANGSGVVVLSVDYRLAPEHPFPQGLNDCIDATVWIRDHAAMLGIDGDRIAVAGDSAGGTLAAGVAAKVDRLRCQVLIYPAVDPAFATPSWNAFADGPVLTMKSAHELWAYYTKTQTIDAVMIPADDLSGMPDTFLITGAYDPLVDEVEAFAAKLCHAHVPVTVKVYPEMIHGFFQFGGVIDQGREAIADVAKYLRYRLEA